MGLNPLATFTPRLPLRRSDAVPGEGAGGKEHGADRAPDSFPASTRAITFPSSLPLGPPCKIIFEESLMLP